MVMGNEAFETFARAEIDGLLRFATALTGDRELGRDLVQDVLHKAYRRWTVVATTDQPRAYVRSMLTKEFLSWRRLWANRNISLAVTELPDGPPVADPAEAITERDAIARRLDILPPRQRSVLVLHYYEQLTYPEIAEVLGCSAATARGYAARALKSLRLVTESSTSLFEEKS